MISNTEHTRQKILKTFEEAPNHHWMTLAEIQNATGSPTHEITQIIHDSDDFVQSSKVILGEPMYTTREAFRTRESFMSKIVGAFKNRID